MGKKMFYFLNSLFHWGVAFARVTSTIFRINKYPSHQASSFNPIKAIDIEYLLDKNKLLINRYYLLRA